MNKRKKIEIIDYYWMLFLHKISKFIYYKLSPSLRSNFVFKKTIKYLDRYSVFYGRIIKKCKGKSKSWISIYLVKNDIRPILNKKDYDNFGKEFRVTNDIFEHYFMLVGTIEESFLNKYQKTLYYFSIVDGGIGNGGMWHILLESLGEFNNGFQEALLEIGDEDGYKAFSSIIELFYKYEESCMSSGNIKFEKEGSKEEEQLLKLVDEIEESYYSSSNQRERLLEKYYVKNKNKFVRLL